MARKPDAQQVESSPPLRLVGQAEKAADATPSIDRDHQGSDDPANDAISLIDSMSRRIDVLAKEFHLRCDQIGDEGEPRPRAA